MKIQNLAVIFIIIVLPISLILSSYVQSQTKTLSLQISYDSKLNNATYDALKAFQLNTINSSTSDLANSKLRDIEASVNTFFNSISSNFNMSGYNQDILKEYVPALVYTMYDGYYIYSPYNNTITGEEENPKDENGDRLTDENGNPTKVTYHNGDRLSGLKPYIHYSCRYQTSSIDVVITYSLDNYITVEGMINNNPVCKSGYLLDNIVLDSGIVTYRNNEITGETLTQYVDDDYNKQVTYVKVNGTKYYKDQKGWYSILNNDKIYQELTYKEMNYAAQQYYVEAYNFSKWLKDSGLNDLDGSNAVDENGNSLKEKFGNKKIFDFKTSSDNNYDDSIEDPDSNFNEHRLAVIRYSIEKNLSIAIANFNNYTGVKTNFQMPVLKEDEWTKIINNVSIISFMQGLNIGGKVYNGYSIITNTKNNEVVSDESIYLTDNNYYYKPTDSTLNTNNNYTGILNVDFEREATYDENQGLTKYFFPRKEYGSYTSIVNHTNDVNLDNEKYKNNIYKYIDEKSGNIAKAYYTALGREKYSSYKTNTSTDRVEVNGKRKYYDDGLNAAYVKN